MTRDPAVPPVDEHTQAELEDAVLHLLSEGRIDEVLARLDRWPAGGGRELFVELARADARFRTLRLEVRELQRLQQRVDQRDPRDVGLHLWVHALICERLLIDGDPTGVLIARTLLDELPTDPLPPVLVTYAGARIKRLVADGWLFAPTPEALIAHRELAEEVACDLIRCGFREEAAVTRGVSAGMQAMMWSEQIDENLEVLIDARRALRVDDGSHWPAMLDMFLMTTALFAGDLDTVHDALARLDRPAVHYPYVRIIAGLVRSLLDLVESGASDEAFAEIDRALAPVIADHPRWAHAWQGQIANALADLGDPRAARYERAAAVSPMNSAAQKTERELLRLRIAALEGDPPSVTDVKQLVEEMAATGRRRQAARLAMRLARDLARAGAASDAKVLHSWGLDHLPHAGRRTIWEQLLSEPLPDDGWGDGPAAGAADAGVRVEVLAPVLAVEIDGRPVALTDAQAKLLLALTVAHPTPVHVEQVADLLWPDATVAAARPRLSTLLHRLRRALPDGPAVVVRTGDLLSLPADDLDIDLLRLRDVLAGDGTDRLRALAAVRGNLCATQFPYDDPFIDARHRFAAEWVRHARALAATDEERHLLDHARHALDLPNDALLG